MRICLASIHPRALSGQIEGLVGLGKTLEQLGHSVKLVSAFGDDLGRKDRLALAERDGGFLLGKVTRIRSILAELARQSQHADLVHLNLPTPAFAVLGDLLQSRVAVPVVVGFEAHLAETGRLLRSGHLIAAPRFYLPRVLVNNGLMARCTRHRCPRYIVSSYCQAAELRRLGFPAASISVVPNVVESDKLQPLGRSEARRQLDLPDGWLIAYVGHYNHVKGVEVLVDAFGQLAARRDDCRLVLAWSGLGDPRPVERAIRRLGLGDRVLCRGRLPMGPFLSAVDVLALPYRSTMGQNAFPGLILEAMTVGVPLVTSDLPLLRELLADGCSALLAPPGNAASTAGAIERLLDNGRLAGGMVEYQCRLLAGPLNPMEVAKRYVTIYRQACGGKAVVLRPAEGEPALRLATVRRGERPVGQPAGAEPCAVATAAIREDT